MNAPTESVAKKTSIRTKCTLPILAAVSFSIGFITAEVRNRSHSNVVIAPTQENILPPIIMDPIIPLNDELVKKYDIDGGVCYLYPDATQGALSCAYVIQDGRYPIEHFKMNKECTEAFFIIDGKYELTLGNETRTLKAKDVVYVPLHTPYAIEGKGTSFVFITPKWNSAQNVPCDQNGVEIIKATE